MAANEDRKRLRQLNQRIRVKKEDLGRLREELSALNAERKTIREKLAGEVAEAAASES